MDLERIVERAAGTYIAIRIIDAVMSVLLMLAVLLLFGAVLAPTLRGLIK